MSVNPDDFFGSAGGDYAPGWWTGQVGNSIAGTIVEEPVVMDQTDFTTKQPIYERKNGQVVVDPTTGQPRIKKQLKVILDTPLRNWQGLKQAPLDQETNQPRPPHEDDGRRAVYIKGWMTGAVGDAIRAAGQTGAPRKGGKLAVRVTELVATSNGNPYPKYEARYQPPAAGDAMFAEPPAAQQAPPAQQAPQQQGWGSEQAPQAPQSTAQPQAWAAPPAPGQAPGPTPQQQAQQAADPWATGGSVDFGDEPPF